MIPLNLTCTPMMRKWRLKSMMPQTPTASPRGSSIKPSEIRLGMERSHAALRSATAGQTGDFDQMSAWIKYDFLSQIPEEGMTSDQYLVSVAWGNVSNLAVGYSNFNLACDKNWTDWGDGFVLNSTTAGANECSWPMFRLELETRRYADNCD